MNDMLPLLLPFRIGIYVWMYVVGRVFFFLKKKTFTFLLPIYMVFFFRTFLDRNREFFHLFFFTSLPLF